MIDDTFPCIRCEEWKPLSGFSVRAGGRRDRTCKKCRVVLARHWYAANKERKRQYDQKYRQVYGEIRRDQDRAYYAANGERVRAVVRAYRTNNRPKYNAQKRAYWARNIEKRRAYYRAYVAIPHHKAHRLLYSRRHRALRPDLQAAKRARRKAWKLGCVGTFTAAEWRTLCAKYDHRCLACGGRKRLTVDHITPLSKGGRNDIDNIQPLCRECNSSKGTKSTDYRPKETPSTT